MAAASATAEPEMPPKNMEAATLTWPSPPRMWPNRASANFTSRPAMLVSPASAPARMNRGNATSGKELTALTILCGTTPSGKASPMIERHDGGKAHAETDRHADEQGDGEDDEYDEDHDCAPPISRLSAPARCSTAMIAISADDTGTQA